jgi:hypothetical protein
MTREWFTTYCQNAAANVLDKDGEVRFTYIELRDSLNAASEHRAECVVPAILKLHDNIVNLCDARCGKQMKGDNDEYALLLTLLNIHAAYLMLSGLWKEEKPVQTGGVDEYGFEIF